MEVICCGTLTLSPRLTKINSQLGPFRGTSEHPEEDLLEGQIKVTGEEKRQETCCEKVSEQEVCLSREGEAQAALKCEGDAFAKHPEEEEVKSRSGEIQK